MDDAAPPPFITFDFGGFEQLGFTKAGYSQIMADDEAATLSALKSCLSEIVEPCVSQHDGFLAEFPSVVQAVACAGDIQRTMAARYLRTGTLPLLFRIGVHLGDVMAEGDEVFGDGVNVAARLQPLAGAGGVRISRQTYDHVEGKLGVTYRSLGDQRLKNIHRPIGVYAAEFVAMARAWPHRRSSRRSNTAAPRIARGWATPRLGKGCARQGRELAEPPGAGLG